MLAEKGDDLSFRRLRPKKVGSPQSGQRRARTRCWTGRLSLCGQGRRPGELVRLTGIVRDDRGEIPDLKTPLELRVFRPDGKVAESVTVRLQKGGIFHYDFQTPREAWTGTWAFGLFLPGTDREIASIKSGVEAFVPVRLEVNSEPVLPWFGWAGLARGRDSQPVPLRGLRHRAPRFG